MTPAPLLDQSTATDQVDLTNDLPYVGSLKLRVNERHCEAMVYSNSIFNFITEGKARTVGLDVRRRGFRISGTRPGDYIEVNGIAAATVSLGKVSSVTSFLVTDRIGPLILGKTFLDDFPAKLQHKESFGPSLSFSDSKGDKYFAPIKLRENSTPVLRHN
ncbi:hypothetical protein PTTG_28668 [Puccinia triticina 1-1 BBBD Race 1]|uniref:Uncharacterized protein n=2 Tax=Puccinia triticina TaxID=208348 RepID=A0A180GAX8_PUCT1|nr:uncharacterized protein PtA15_1A539 [Puccinia triticina]OAV89482.1 hypothetical protein PTTG_28668 [Puccinia triticina 1-1 BBBD Race 1]WAQ81199.1 hypothetical protein PtA15_1A539 [Puccinia triticina]